MSSLIRIFRNTKYVLFGYLIVLAISVSLWGIDSTLIDFLFLKSKSGAEVWIIYFIIFLISTAIGFLLAHAYIYFNVLKLMIIWFKNKQYFFDNKKKVHEWKGNQGETIIVRLMAYSKTLLESKNFIAFLFVMSQIFIPFFTLEFLITKMIDKYNEINKKREEHLWSLKRSVDEFTAFTISMINVLTVFLISRFIYAGDIIYLIEGLLFLIASVFLTTFLSLFSLKIFLALFINKPEVGIIPFWQIKAIENTKKWAELERVTLENKKLELELNSVGLQDPLAKVTPGQQDKGQTQKILDVEQTTFEQDKAKQLKAMEEKIEAEIKKEGK